MSTERQMVQLAVDDLLLACPPDRTDDAAFLGAQFDAGLAWVHFDKGYGGLGIDRVHQDSISARLAAAGAADPFRTNGIGYGMVAPTIHAFGTVDQRERFLRPMFTNDEIWCQLFSEPSAGSDVAGLATRAARDGDKWIIDGQKVWTTFAHRSSFGLLLARTDPDVEKHRGLTMFLVDMQQPGVEVRPLRQMSGDAEFNEVFFDGARVDDSRRVGDVGDGWRVAIGTLMNERVSVGTLAIHITVGIQAMLALYRSAQAGGGLARSERDRVLRTYVEALVTRSTIDRASASLKRGTPGPEGSTVKLAFTEFYKRLTALCLDLRGADSLLYEEYNLTEMKRVGDISGDPGYQFLRARASTLEGGTSEVLRNILGERVLGLPPDVRVDKGRPWSDIPRS